VEAHFLFFDIDGVLIDPKGYRQATKDTIRVIGARYGLNISSISELELTAFESQGITSEWDMVPLYLLAWIENCLILLPQKSSISDRDKLCYLLRDLDQAHIKPLNIINNYGSYVNYSQPPSDSIRNEIFNGNQACCLPLLYQSAPWLIREFLTFTRDIEKSETTMMFQNLILGSEYFEELSEVKPEISTPSYLLMHDKTIIDDQLKNKLNYLFDYKKVYISAMTARPSLAPEFFPDKEFTRLFSPEAEFAMEKIGLSTIPVVGYGALDALGEKLGFNGDILLKPSPIHALIALALGCNIDFANIYDFLKINKNLISNYNFSRLNLKSFLPDWMLEREIYLHIFEDTIVGIRSVRALNEILINNGYRSQYISFGITSDNQKINVLKKENAQIFQNINEALSYYFENNDF